MARKTPQSTIDAFKAFVSENPTLSANKLLKGFRAETGLSIGNEKGKELVRDVRNLELNTAKQAASKSRYVTLRDIEESKKFYLNKYTYIVQYTTLNADGSMDSTENFITVGGSKRMTNKQVRARVIETFKEDIEGHYHPKVLVVDSIRIIDAFYNEDPFGSNKKYFEKMKKRK